MVIFFSDAGQRREPAGAQSMWVDDGLISAFLGYERRARLLRGEIFDANVINESGWLLLQELFAAHLEGEKMRTKQLCATSGLPQTTVLRYLDHLERFDVIRREDDPDDSRVTLVSVTEAGAFWLREYYTRAIAIEHDLARRRGCGILSLDAAAFAGLEAHRAKR
jgi:DNA-binding MarR family transcriptional regulator